MTTDRKEQRSQTPRTEEAEDRCRECGLSFVPREDMEKLEIELAEAKEIIQRLATDEVIEIDKNGVVHYPAARPSLGAPQSPVELPAAVQECIDSYAKNYEHRVYGLGENIRTDMQHVAEVAMRWARDAAGRKP